MGGGDGEANNAFAQSRGSQLAKQKKKVSYKVYMLKLKGCVRHSVQLGGGCGNRGVAQPLRVS